MRDRDNPCHFCGEMTNSLAGNPGLWPLIFCIDGCNGKAKTFHTKCVSDRLSQLAAEKEARVKDAESTTVFVNALRYNLDRITNLYQECSTAKETAEARVKELEAEVERLKNGAR